jgi:hypothetical protein
MSSCSARRSRARATGKCWGHWKAKNGVSHGSLEGMGRRRSHVKGPLAALPVKEAGSARGGSGWIIQKDKESA